MLRIVDRGNGWAVEATWLGATRVVFGPKHGVRGIRACLRYVDNEKGDTNGCTA